MKWDGPVPRPACRGPVEVVTMAGVPGRGPVSLQPAELLAFRAIGRRRGCGACQGCAAAEAMAVDLAAQLGSCRSHWEQNLLALALLRAGQYGTARITGQDRRPLSRWRAWRCRPLLDYLDALLRTAAEMQLHSIGPADPPVDL